MNSRKPSRHVSWAHKPNPSFACSPPCNSSVLIDTSAEQKWPPIVDSRKPSRHVFWAHKPNPSFVCSPPNDSSVSIAALTLWPSGQGVGLLSQWGLPAWVRIPQVSLLSLTPQQSSDLSTAPRPWHRLPPPLLIKLCSSLACTRHFGRAVKASAC